VTDLGIAVIGPGAIADAHLAAFAELGGIRAVWAVGRDPDRTKAFAQRWGIERSGIDVVDALADPAVDVALICSPNGLHAAQAVQALDAGKDVILEIPIAMSEDESRYIVEVAEERGRRVFACHTMRSFAGIRYMHDLVVSGTEEIAQVTGFFAIPRRGNEGFAGTRTWVDDLLWHHACHLVDATLWVSGNKDIAFPTLLRGIDHPNLGMTMDMTMSFGMGGPAWCIASHSLTYNASALTWQMRFCGSRGDYLFDAGRLYGTGGELLVEGASIRDLSFQNAQILHGLRSGSSTDFEARDVLATMRAMRLLEEAGNR
jgi:2-hydroxy-4-carboxymuconate semialdehyde hemiacetal dehydrogenase